MVDRIGVKKGYALSIGLWALASLSHSFARTALGFGLARFALGIGESGNFPSALKATADGQNILQRQFDVFDFGEFWHE